MSAPACAWAIEQGRIRKLPASARLVLIVLAERANGVREAWPMLETICADTGLQVRAVRNAVHALEAAGLIERQRRHKSWLYRVLRPKDKEAAHPPAPRAAVQRTTPAADAANGKQHRHQMPVSSAPDAAEHRHHVPLEPRKKNQDKNLSSFYEADAVPASSETSARDELWAEGVRIVQRLMGVMDSGARNFLGKLLKGAKDDCSLVLAKLREAERNRPLDPAPWLIAACVPFRNAGLALIADEGLPSQQELEMNAIMQRLLAANAHGHA